MQVSSAQVHAFPAWYLSYKYLIILNTEFHLGTQSLTTIFHLYCISLPCIFFSLIGLQVSFKEVLGQTCFGRYFFLFPAGLCVETLE